MSLTSLDCLVDNIYPVSNSSQVWFESVSQAVKAGAWSDVDTFVKYCSLKPYAPSTGKFNFGLYHSFKSAINKYVFVYLAYFIKLTVPHPSKFISTLNEHFLGLIF